MTHLLIVTGVCLLANLLVSAQSSGVFFSEGFESGLTQTFNSNFYGRLTQSQFRQQSAVRVAGNYALEHFLPTGAPVQYATQHFADAHQGPVYAARLGEHLEDIYVQYKVYYSSNFDLSTPPKQLIIGTEDDRRHDNVCCNPWVAHYMTIFPPFGDVRNAEANNKQAPSGQWIGFNQNASGYNSANRFRMQLGRWYTVEVRRRLNDSGVDNGIFQMWIDGTLLMDHRTVRFRTPWNGTVGSNFTYGTNFVMISEWIFGDGGSTRDESVYYDDIKISTTYIGGATSGLPSAPTNLRLIPGFDR